ncbi:uncharacterized protein LOC108677508 isoform X2 [Hyalella azteca]|uniref:Uncharacterized protein LOC108677508 isoform X2 n=1 Tax=Hyalella azteca TaxID=294128 RepID=A0A8B7P5L2_HYAAZ|nr:uncharacterized protein LOC108677508 isoform X2 [Hyalella azteca]
MRDVEGYKVLASADLSDLRNNLKRFIRKYNFKFILCLIFIGASVYVLANYDVKFSASGMDMGCLDSELSRIHQNRARQLQIFSLNSSLIHSTEIGHVNPKCDLPWWDGALDNCWAIQEQFIAQKNKSRSYCGKRADFAGPNQKVLSYCVYGNYSKYASGFPRILDAIRKWYPGWLVRLYTEPSMYVKELRPLMLQHPYLYLCDVSNLPGDIPDVRVPDSMLWRVAVLGDETVDVFLVRDIDAEMLYREVAAVHEFLESGKMLHIMRDHPWHGVSLLGGTYGVNQAACNRSLLNLIRRQVFDQRQKINDQSVLQLVHSSISHDSYSCQHFPSTVPFPTQRNASQFVGNRRYRSQFSDDVVKAECPVKCRPPTHQDWKFC